MAIIKNFVKVLFPFQYDKDAEIHLEEVEISTKKGNPHKLFQRVGFENAELRKGLSELEGRGIVFRIIIMNAIQRMVLRELKWGVYTKSIPVPGKNRIVHLGISVKIMTGSDGKKRGFLYSLRK